MLLALTVYARTHTATSQLFVPPPQQSNFLPASEDGAIADAHVTAFQASIDSLLVAGRSHTPSSVLAAMRAVVGAVTDLDNDIQAFEQRSIHQWSESDRERLQHLKAKCNATLSNLVTAAKNHASSYGLSPVSLLDAAASHLSATIVDMVKLLRIRKAAAYDEPDDRVDRGFARTSSGRSSHTSFTQWKRHRYTCLASRKS